MRATDAAGNTGADATRDYTLDRTVPFAPALDGRPGDDGNDASPEWAFSTTEANRTFECRLARGATVVDDWGPCVSPKNYSLALEVDGPYTFAVRAVNLAGTRSLATHDLYRYDTAAPGGARRLGRPGGRLVRRHADVDVSPEPGATLECRLERGATVVSDWAACSTPQASTSAARSTAPTRSRRARRTRPATPARRAASTYTLDRTVPLAPVIGATPPPRGSDTTPTWEWTRRAGQDVRVPHRRAARPS